MTGRALVGTLRSVPGESEVLDLAVSLCERRVPMDDAIPELVRAAEGSTTAIRAAAIRAASAAGRKPDDALARRVALLLERTVEEAAAHEWQASAELIHDARAPLTAPAAIDLRDREPEPEPEPEREPVAHSSVAEYLASAAKVSGNEVIDLEKVAAAATEKPRRTLAEALADAAQERGEA